ncbi:MAG TPA: purine nucleoside permease [Pseudomonadales bacterium]|nr:purine nucleoside permease [Pseudomonadales bacterium]
MTLRSIRLVFFLLLTCAGASACAATASDAPATALPVKVVVVTMFEHGEPSGDRPGELQYWVERWPLPQRMDFPAGEFPLHYSPDGVLAICTGGGIANATASIMALGLDPRFDLSDAYWLIAGIAGGDPEDTSLGSAVWASHVVDGDLLYEIDAREIPEDWPWGLIPLGAEHPATKPADIYTGWTLDTVHFALDADLAEWAFETSADVELEDTPAMREFRARFTDRPAARRPPSVMRGETLASGTYWHGNLMNRWANAWVAAYAGEDANFMTTNMEDTGTLTAIGRLGRVGRADPSRVMVLRTVSNFSTPPAGETAAWSTTAPYPDQGRPALESAWRAGSVVVRALVDDWNRYATTPPAPTNRDGAQP